MTTRPSAKFIRAAQFAEIGADSLDSGKVIPYLAVRDFDAGLKRESGNGHRCRQSIS